MCSDVVLLPQFQNESKVPFFLLSVLYSRMNFWEILCDVLIWKSPKMERLSQGVLCQPHREICVLELGCEAFSHPLWALISSLWRRTGTRPQRVGTPLTQGQQSRRPDVLSPFNLCFRLSRSPLRNDSMHFFPPVLSHVLFFFRTSALEIRFCYL